MMAQVEVLGTAGHGLLVTGHFFGVVFNIVFHEDKRNTALALFHGLAFAVSAGCLYQHIKDCDK